MSEERKTPKRTRDVQILMRLTPKENELLIKRMTEAGMTNRNVFLRRMALKGFILRLDMKDFKETNMLLRSAANNINQIARRVNENGSAYRSDINELREKYEALRADFAGIREQLTGL
ncbi:MAG: plasmid mobilization relaxosome protein MobC [Clostridiales bacterium]|jgi:hypothetical protein|nr:plasmid mobilization relaxosome protein MobC [Clostridiales bacterium]